MKWILTLSLFFFSITSLNSQCTEDIILFTQNQVDNFTTDFSCETVIGNLIIGNLLSNNPTNIIDLTPLNEISEVTGNITIYNSSLTQLEGLSNLTQIGGSLVIENNEELLAINDFDNLQTIGNQIIIKNNPQLLTINTFESLVLVGNDLKIKEHSSLIGIPLFYNLTTVGGSIEISENTDLFHLDSFNELEVLGGNIVIQQNSQLETIEGFNGLALCTGDVIINQNGSLQSIDGFESVDYLSGSLELNSNPNLSSYDAFFNITEVGGSLIIVGTSLETLNGFENISIINENLNLGNNGYLVDISALENISFIGGVLAIFSNDMLFACLLNSQLVEVTQGAVTIYNNGLGVYYLESQAQIDAFPSIFFGCSEIGTLVIRDFEGAVYNLDSLYQIETINGNLEIIGNDSLTNIDGLSNLTTIGGSLYIGKESNSYFEQGNPNLENVDGLINLTSIGQTLGMFENASLQNIDGLSNLSAVGNNFYICKNDLLLNLDGLSSLTTIGGNFFIGDYSTCGNASLENIDGLLNLINVGADLKIVGNTSLQNIDGLLGITTLNSGLRIDYNDSLQNINGLSNLTSIEYGIIITFNDMLENIDGLSNLSYVLSISISSNPVLSNINALSNISEVGFRLRISHNDALVNLEGLENINEIGNDLEINSNNEITNLDPLLNLTSIQGDLIIDNNSNLTNIDGLSNLLSLDGALLIRSNESLTNLDAFSNLTSIGGSLAIGNEYAMSQSLENIDGLSNLTYVGNHLVIREDSGLSNLDALSNINFIGGFLEISNSNLIDIDGLSNVTILGDDLIIEDNDNLSDCCTALYLAGIAQGEQITIEDNAFGCTSIDEAVTFCDIIKVTCKAFFDENENNIKEEDEIILTNSFTLSPSEYFSYSNQETGAVFFLDEFGNYTVSLNDFNPLWILNDGASDSVIINYTSSNFTDTFHYFPLVPIGDFTLQDVDLTSSITRCNQNTNYWITYANNGTTINDGYVQLVPDEVASFSYAIPAADSTAGDTLFWFYEDLYPTHSGQIRAVYSMPSVDFIGDEIGFEAGIRTWEGLGGDKAPLSSELICAYDPNDKLVTPAGVGAENYTLNGDTLEYTIRFQNTGNDTAFTVIVRDTLDTQLDLESFRPISSSHTVQTTIEVNERIATFTFENIYLPDSFVNEVGSHGFVKFRILSNGDLANFTPIENTAGIFFDANPPIVTNTVDNTFTSDIPSVFFGKIFLEGAYEGNGQMTNLLGDLIPLEQSFNTNPWNYEGTETLNNLPENMLDWVLVEARTGTPSLTNPSTEIVEQHAGILLANGEILNTDGTTGIRFLNLQENEQYYISIRHRNHLDIISATPITPALNMGYDFTTNTASAFGPEQQKLSNDGRAMMIAGDANGDGLIQATDYDAWFINNAVINTYSPTDFNLDGIIQTTDYDLWFLNKAKVGIGELQY